MSKIFRAVIFSLFFGIATWIGVHILSIIFVFPDWRIQALTISVLTFIIVIAVKRGVFH